MTAKNSANGLLAKRYATSLIETAEQAKVLDKVEKDVAELAAMIEESEELRFFLTNPLFGKDQQISVLIGLSQKAKLQKITENFLNVLIAKSRVFVLEAILDSFNEELAIKRGEVNAQVVTAIKMTQKQTKALEDKVAKSIGRKVSLDVQVDESLIGGLVITIGSRMVDASVKRKLERLENALKNNSNQNTVNNEKEVG